MKNEKVILVAVVLMWVLVFVVAAIELTLNTNATSLDKQTVFKNNGTEFNTGSFVHNGRVFVPLRMLSEKLGYTVRWDGKDKTISIFNNQYSAMFKLKSKFIYLHGEDSIEMDVEPLVIDNTTFVPLRYAVESLGKYIELYDSKTLRIINITDYNPTQEVSR